MSLPSRPSLRERLQEDRILVALGAHDGLTARIAEQAGIEALYHGGYAVAAHHLGVPDIGIAGMSDMTGSIARMAAVTALPILADADTGFGAEPGVRRTVQSYEAAGAGAVQIEDQQFPKKCGHMEGKRVIARDEMVLKVKAAVAARRDPETIIIARTDALQVHGVDDAIERCHAFAEAGADVAMVDAPPTVEDIERIAREVQIPTLANLSETGRSPFVPTDQLEAWGYKIAIFPSTQTWLFAKAYRELAEEVVRTRSTEGIRDRFDSFDEVNSLLGLAEWERS